MSSSTINLYMLLVSMKYIGVYSRNYIIHVPKGMGAAQALDGLENMMFGVAKPLPTVAGSPNRGVNMELIVPPSRNIHNQAAHNPQPSHSIARQLQNVKSPMPVTLRSENTSTTKRLAYKADLIKALDDLQKRQATKCSKNNKSCSHNKTTDYEDTPTFDTSTRSKIKKPNSLDEILELIQGGLHVNRNRKPSRENVEWMKIKIPRQ